MRAVNRRIFLDLDHTLADFNKTFQSHFGDKLEESGLNMTKYDWARINMISNFYEILDKFDYTDTLLAKLYSRFPIDNIAIITSNPSEYAHNAWMDKTRWVHKNIGQNIPILFSGGKIKKSYFLPKRGINILIDDKKECIFDWNYNGGIGILWRESMGYDLNWVDKL